MKENILLGLKRLSWLSAAIVGFITMVILATEEGWDYPEDYLPMTILFTVATFLLFRIGIWVTKGFHETENTDDKKE